MLLRGLNPFGLNLNLAPDDGGGAGGSGGGETPPNPQGGDDKKFTEKDVQERIEKSMKHWRKGLQKEVADKDKAIDDLKKEIEDLKTVLTVGGKGDGTNKTPETAAGQWELERLKLTRQIEDLSRKVTESDAKRAEAEKRAEEQRRDTAINQALTEAGCRDLRIGYRTVRDDVTLDEVDGKYVIKTTSGSLVDLNGDNMKELLPDYLKVNSTVGGGSGSTGGMTARAAQKHAELEDEKKKLEELHARMNRQPNDRNVKEYQSQKRKVAALVAALK